MKHLSFQSVAVPVPADASSVWGLMIVVLFVSFFFNRELSENIKTE